MNIIISPTKQMTQEDDAFLPLTQPLFLKQTKLILDSLKTLSFEEAQTLWKCNDQLAQENYDRIQQADLATSHTTAAILSYKGLQYQYMSPDLLTEPALDYLQEHLRILSGFYGILRPFDGIVPYRLEMQARLAVTDTTNLYHFWADTLYNALSFDKGPVVNLASKEYSKALLPYLKPTDTLINIDFVHLIDGKLKTKATLAKMARGEMVRYLAENQIKTIEGIKTFTHPHYRYSKELSTESNYVFQFHD